ncbi:hypothetical protein BH23THE1_BH23THE1_26030 [soil metagenome]
MSLNNYWELHTIFESIKDYFNPVNKVLRMKMKYTVGHQSLILGDGFSDLNL